MSDEIETFIDDPRQSAPLPLKASMGNHENRRDMETDKYEDLGWRCFYLLALLPPHLRCPFDQAYQDSVHEHFRLVYREAKTAKTQLIEGTLRYAIVVARLYLGRGIPFLDLVQEGTLGIASAAERYNEQRGAHFQAYATVWIRQRIERYISDRGRLIRIPVHQLEIVHKIDRYVEEFLDRQGKPPTDFQVFLQMGWMDASDLHLVEEALTVQRRKQLEVKQREFGALLQIARDSGSAHQTLSSVEDSCCTKEHQAMERAIWA